MITKKIIGFIAAALLLALNACEPEEILTSFPPDQMVFKEASPDWGEMPLKIAAVMGEGSRTKASLLRDVESKGSGALVLVFRSATRQLDSYRFFSQEELDSQGSVPLRLRVPLAECDFYILGNLNGIRRSDGAAVNLMDALGAEFPVDENTLEAMVYRLDGGSLNTGFRRETFAEVASCGIPYVLCSRNVNTVRQISQGQGIPGSESCRRLFSKVTLRIDHAAFDGAGAHPEFFVNDKLYLRQANGRLQPFSQTPQKAQETADVLAQSDYDPDMSSTSASVTTFSFYVPENMQGTLLPGNADSRRKTRETLLAEHLSAVEPYLTYIEFSGHLDPAAGGYGGDVTYRFYLGSDNCSNFDLERGREYQISLSFRVGSLFDADWKVETDNWTDRRLFCLTGDPGFTDRLPEGRLLAVRSNRAGALYVYMNPAGQLGATNALVGREAASSASFVPESLADCAWYGDLMASGTADRNWLSSRGITPSWDKAEGRLRLSVTDPGLFGSHLGEERSFTLTLLPAGGTTRFSVRLMADIGISVADGKSLTDEFYLGQKRTVTLNGFSGTTLCYAADQDPCGPVTGQAHTSNRQWKASSSASAAFPTARLDGTGHVVLKPSEYASQTLSGRSLDIYAWYPNRFQSSHGWTSKTGRIIFFSDDYLNDSVEAEVRISEPKLKTCSVSGTLCLPVDGTQLDCGGTFGYLDYDGNLALDASQFEPALYADLLAFRPQTYTDSWLECVGMDMEGFKIYCAKTSCSKGNLEDLSYGSSSGRTSLTTNHTFIIPVNPATGLFSGRVYDCKIDYARLVLTSFSADGTQYSSGAGRNYTVRYFIPKNARDGVDQYTEDETFSLYVKYRFLNSDLGTMTIERTGTASSYTASNGQTFGPVMELAVDSFDSGSGGVLQWLYDESHQTMTASNGEHVPGGLLLPYGTQSVNFKYKNRWDGREFSENASFSISYTTPFAFFVGATNASRNARIFVVPAKNVKYLKRCAAGASLANRTWMTRLFGHRTWSDYVKVTRAYPYQDGVNTAYHYEGSARSFPLTDFDCTYIPSYGGTAWSASAITALDGYVADSNTSLWSPNVYSRHLLGTSVERPSAPAQFGTGLNQTIMNFAGSDGYAADGSVNGWVQGMYISTGEVFAE